MSGGRRVFRFPISLFRSLTSALSCRSIACDLSSASVKCNAKNLCALCVLRVKHITPHGDYSSHAKNAETAKITSPITLALEKHS